MQTEVPARIVTTDRWFGPLFLQRPSDAFVGSVVASMASSAFTYGPVGATRHALPEGWVHDRVEGVIGRGDAAWAASTEALRSWSQFDLSWVVPHDRTVPLAPGATFAFLSRQLGLWSVNVCRVVYVVHDQRGGGERFGFAYGTVGSHVVKGEERFLVERDAEGVVRFSIAKFSRPAHPLVRLAGPLTRHIQRRFSVDALARMQRAVTP